MPVDPIPRDLSQAVAALAVLWAALQWILARWRDLGPVTVGWVGCALILGLPGGLYPVIAGLIALGVAVLAQMRASRHGVGRPDLTMLALAGAAFGGLLPLWAGALWPDLDPERLRAVGLMPALLTGAVGGLLALERPGIRARPPRWVGRLPVEGADHGPPSR